MHPSASIYLCGPTASGKSTLAIELANALDGEIVNADAYQLYRGLETLTAAPSQDEQAQVPHHLYGVLSATETCDAMRYREMALPCLEAIMARGKTPIVTGGSGLYLKFLTHGPSPVPSGDPQLRARLDQLELSALVARLQQLDPIEAERTDLQNRRYVTRAVEICELTGKRCSELRDQWKSAHDATDRQLRGLYIQRDRAALHERIHRRTHQMLKGPAIEEVRQLGPCSETFKKAIGYREIRELIHGETDLARCEEKILFATRQYAKRQETWFRREPWLKALAWEEGKPPPTKKASEWMQELGN